MIIVDPEERRPVASRSPAMSDRGYGPEESVVLTDIDIPFERLVAIMVKWSLASVPALLIGLAIAYIIGALMGYLLVGLGLWPW